MSSSHAGEAAQLEPQPPSGGGFSGEAEWQDEEAPAPPLRSCALDVLLADGPEALREVVTELGLRPYPLPGLLDLNSLWEQLVLHHRGGELAAQGVSTGWTGLDELYKVAPGELTIVTGVPNSGKSHWLDALAVQLASYQGWCIAFASFEKSVVRHAQNLIELAARKPMFTRQGTPHLTLSEFEEALSWISRHFILIRHADMADEPAVVQGAQSLGLAPRRRWGEEVRAGQDEAAAEAQADEEEDLRRQRLEDARRPCTIDWVLEKATQAVHQFGIKGLVIDPYNELEQRRGAMSETEYVSALLSKVKRWAQLHKVHVWLVAHPKSMEQWDGSAPSMYDISGSAHWYNKADMGVVVHRYTPAAIEAAIRQNPILSKKRIPWLENETLIKVCKARNKTSGAQGEYTLEYDREQCRFRDPRMERSMHLEPR